MKLKHAGKKVLVALVKPEERLLEKTLGLLGSIALLPCDQQEAAKAAAEQLGVVMSAMKAKDQSSGDDLSDQQMLPMGT